MEACLLKVDALAPMCPFGMIVAPVLFWGKACQTRVGWRGVGTLAVRAGGALRRVDAPRADGRRATVEHRAERVVHRLWSSVHSLEGILENIL